MKRIFALFTSLCVACAAFSCTKKSAETSATEAAIHTLYLSEVQLSAADSISQIQAVDGYGTRILVAGSTGGKYRVVLTDNAFGTPDSFDFTPQEGESVKSAALGQYGKIGILTWCDDETYLNVFASDGTAQDRFSLGELIWSEDTYASLLGYDGGWLVDIDSAELHAVTAEGTVSNEVDLSRRMLLGFTRNAENRPVVFLSNGEDSAIAAVTDGALTDEQPCSRIPMSAMAACAGSGEYTQTAMFGGKLYGLFGSEWSEMCDFMDNSISGEDIRGLVYTGDDSFMTWVEGASGSELWLLTAGEAPPVKTPIVLAVFDNIPNDYTDFIKDYNSSSDEYRVELRQYCDGYMDECIEQLKADMLTDNCPDIIAQRRGWLNVDSFGARDSLFVDMYGLIDSDPTISRGDFVDGFLEGLDYNGRLLSITPGFNIQTIAVKDKFLSGLTSWTLPQMTAVFDSLPDSTHILPGMDYHVTMTGLFLSCADYDSFVNYENAECSFTDQRFIDMMNYVRDNHLGRTYQEWLDYANNGEVSDWEYSYVYYRNDMYLMDTEQINTAGTLRRLVKGTFNEPCTLIGNAVANEGDFGSFAVPSDEYNFAIMARSKSIDAAWDFIRTQFLSEEYYHSWYGKRDFPVIEQYLEEQIQSQKEHSVPTEAEIAEGVDPNLDYVWLDTEFTQKEYYDVFTDEECAEYGAFIRECAKHVSKYDPTLYNILSEELMPFFEGERTADETAEIIQSRISIYLSENYG